MSHLVKNLKKQHQTPANIAYAPQQTTPTSKSALLALATIVLCLFECSIASLAQVNVTTFHNDIGRTGQNLNETILTRLNVNPSQFGKLFSQPVDGQIYAQPLYLSAISVNGATHNVVFVATENDSVYAFDADTNGGANAAPLWHASLLSTAHGAATGATTVSASLVGSDITPQIGITGTPVIDPATGTLYVVSKTYESGAAIQRLHALSVSTGAEKFGGPIIITASVAGTGNGSVNGVLTFDSLWENQRPGLLLLNGIVYVGFAAHGDNGPWHGWILGYNAATLKQTGAYCASPNGTGSGFWMSGEALAADQLNVTAHPFGRMFVPTGNGDYTAAKPYSTSMDYGDTDLNLDLTNGKPTVTDEFTTNQQASLNSEDGDVGSGGLIVLPAQPGTYPNLAVQAGKQGTIYLLNRENLGGYNNSFDQALQILPFAVGNYGVWGTPAYWNGTIYYWGKNDYLKAFTLTDGVLSTAPTLSKEEYYYPGATPSISADGTANGIVWSIDAEQVLVGPAVLQAHDANNVATTLYSGLTNPARDNAGFAVKFTVPTIANGKVYVGTATEVDIYGLLSVAPQAPAPVIAPGTKTFSGSLSVTLSDATAGASIYYTTDGSAATTDSNLYKSAITITSTETINAVASVSGLLVSNQTSATYTAADQAQPPVMSIPSGTYASAQTVALSDPTPSAVIYYTTNGAAPTTASTKYSAPITVSTTETITAIAVAQGFVNSAATSATYTISATQTPISFPLGFASSAGLIVLNGSTMLNDTRLQLTDGLEAESGSAWFHIPINIQSFSTTFTFQLSNPNGDGMTFAIQDGPKNINALGGNGYALGYSPIEHSVAIKFDLYNDSGEGPDSTGLYVNGAVPTIPAINLSSTGINLHSDDTMSVTLAYSGTTLKMTLTDIVTAATWSTSWTINIPSTIGVNTAYVGFTGATGAQTASQKILTWTFNNAAGATQGSAAVPTFTPAGGSYSAAQSVTLKDATAGASIYYTTNGSTPTTASTLYSSPIPVTSTQTLRAVAIASGYTLSGAASAAYAITYPAPIGNLEQALDSVTASSSIPVTDILYVSGWIADPTDGSPLSNVKVLIDGASVGTPTLGISRPDVAAAYNNAAYSKSGFHFALSASLLSPGTHTVSVVGVNAHSVSTTLTPAYITVFDQAPVGSLDAAVDSVTSLPTVSRSKGLLYVSGWAADYQDNGPAKSVQILIDGKSAGLATLGESRPDVAASHAKPAWSNTGYSLTLAASTLTLGKHTVSATATDSLHLSATFGPIVINVTP